MGVSRILLTLTASFLVVVPPLVDWTTTHVFHPEWPGHARFHLVQLLAVDSALGILSLLLLWGKGGHEAIRLRLAGVLQVIVLGAFFVATALRPAYEGALTDVRGGVEHAPGGLDANLVTFSVLLVIVLYALWRSRKPA